MTCGEVKIGENMLYAVLENGGKQYKAVEGEAIEVDLLPVEVGKKKTFDKILLLVNETDTQVGSPHLSSVTVDTTVVEHFKGEKVTIFKYRAKQRYRVKTGHRQQYSRVLVNSIAFPGKSKTVKVTEPESEKAAKPAKKRTASKTSSSAKKPAARPAARVTSKKAAASKSPASEKKPAAKTTKAVAAKSSKTTTPKKQTSKKAEDKK